MKKVVPGKKHVVDLSQVPRVFELRNNVTRYVYVYIYESRNKLCESDWYSFYLDTLVRKAKTSEPDVVRMIEYLDKRRFIDIQKTQIHKGRVVYTVRLAFTGSASIYHTPVSRVSPTGKPIHREARSITDEMIAKIQAIPAPQPTRPVVVDEDIWEPPVLTKAERQAQFDDLFAEIMTDRARDNIQYEAWQKLCREKSN
jgi:hypothetical protein